ncbi:hypothetical protein BST61_g7449 [Cercospora zeina]
MLTQALATLMSKVAIIINIIIITTHMRTVVPATTSKTITMIITITITIGMAKIQRTPATDSIRHHTRMARTRPPMEPSHNNIRNFQSARVLNAIANLPLDKLCQY